MPVLIGGSKLKQKKKPFGSVVNISKIERLGRGNEGRTFKLRMNFENKNKQSLVMVAKIYKKGKTGYLLNFRSPERQFKVARELIEYNHRKKLGLNIVRSVRLMVIKNKQKTRNALVTSFIPGTENWPLLSNQAQEGFIEDIQHQIRIMEKNGFTAGFDAFLPKFDGKTGRIIGIIADFGSVARFEVKK